MSNVQLSLYIMYEQECWYLCKIAKHQNHLSDHRENLSRICCLFLVTVFILPLNAIYSTTIKLFFTGTSSKYGQLNKCIAINTLFPCLQNTRRQIPFLCILQQLYTRVLFDYYYSYLIATEQSYYFHIFQYSYYSYFSLCSQFFSIFITYFQNLIPFFSCQK